MPDHPHVPSGAAADINRSINTIVNQVITDDMFKGMNEHILIWEDEERVKGPEEAKELPSKPADDVNIDKSDSGAPLQLALADPGVTSVVAGEADGAVFSGYADGADVSTASADTVQGQHSVDDAHTTPADDGAGSVDHHVDPSTVA